MEIKTCSGCRRLWGEWRDVEELKDQLLSEKTSLIPFPINKQMDLQYAYSEINRLKMYFFSHVLQCRVVAKSCGETLTYEKFNKQNRRVRDVAQDKLWKHYVTDQQGELIDVT